MKRIIRRESLREVFLFVFIGGCSTAIDFILYLIFLHAVNVVIAKGASMIAASVFSYILNKTLTFKVRKQSDTGMVIRFYIVFVLNLLANVSVNWLFYSLLQTEVIPFILATAAGMTVNFLGQKYFVFMEKHFGVSIHQNCSKTGANDLNIHSS